MRKSRFTEEQTIKVLNPQPIRDTFREVNSNALECECDKRGSQLRLDKLQEYSKTATLWTIVRRDSPLRCY
jgi:hypothetical protein